MKTKKLLLFALASIVLLALLAACGESNKEGTTGSGGGGAATATPIPTATTAPTGEQPQYGGVFRQGRQAPASIDPWHSLAGSYHNIALNFNRLIEHKKPHVYQTTTLVPGLATEWSVDETDTVWTFKLREGVTWHDGEVFDANDVEATFERGLDPNLLVARYSIAIRDVIDSMEVVDPYTIVIDTAEPNALTIPWLSNWYMQIVPEHLIRDPNPGPDDTGWLWMQPNVDDPDLGKGTGTLAIGTGPWITTNLDAGETFTHKRNPNYWQFDEYGQRLPYMDGIMSMNQRDATRRVAAFATHDLHDISGASGFSMQKAQTLCDRRSDPCHIDLVEHGYFVSVLNDKIPPFDDPKMREVARWAFDVHKSIALPFQGLVGAPGQWMHMFYPEASLTNEELYAVSPWADPSQRTPVDIWQQKAIDRLTELGFPNGLDLEYPYYVNTSTPLLRDMDSVMLIDITAAGFRVDSASTTGADDALRAGQFSIVRSACGSALADPTGGVALAGLSWSSIVGRRPFAWDGAETADGMYTQANKLIDPIQRGEALKDMERFYADPTLAIVPMGWTLQAWTTPDCLKDTVIGPGLFGSMEFVRTWFTDEGQCRKNLQEDLQSIEPTDLNVVSTVMWNWQ